MNVTFSLRRTTMLLLSTTVVTQLINGGMLLVQARLYTPASVGFIANVMSIGTILTPICTFQLASALPQQRHARDVAEIVILAIISVTVMVTLLATAAFIVIPNMPGLSMTLAMAIAGIALVPFVALNDLLRMLAAREGAFRAVGMQNIVLALVRAVIQAVGGFFGSTGLWLFMGEAVGRFSILSIATDKVLKVWRTARTEPLDIRASLRAHWRFPAISMPSALVDNVAGYFPPILIGQMFGVEAAGIYFLARRVVSLPILLLVSSTADAFQVRAAQILHKDKEGLSRFVFRAAAAFFGIGIVTTASLGLFIFFLWTWTFGPKWVSAQNMALALLIPGVFQTAVTPLTRILIVTNRQAMKLVFDSTFLLATFSPLLWRLAGWPLNVFQAVLYMSLGYTAAYVVYLVIVLLAASRPLDIKRLGP